MSVLNLKNGSSTNVIKCPDKRVHLETDETPSPNGIKRVKKTNRKGIAGIINYICLDNISVIMHILPVLTFDPEVLVVIIVILLLPIYFLRKENKETIKTQVDGVIEPRGGIIVAYSEIVKFIRNRGCEISSVKPDRVELKGKYESWVLRIDSYKDIVVSVINHHPLLGEKYKKEWHDSVRLIDDSAVLSQIIHSIKELDGKIERIENAIR